MIFLEVFPSIFLKYFGSIPFAGLLIVIMLCLIFLFFSIKTFAVIPRLSSPIQIEVDAPQQHYDAVGSWRRIRMVYADGCEIILDGQGKDERVPYIEGPEGKLYTKLESNIPNLKEKLKSLPDPEPRVTDFSESVRTRQKFALNESFGHRSCTLVNLGKIVIRLGRNLQFDPVKQEFIDDEGANRLLRQPMRAPWFI